MIVEVVDVIQLSAHILYVGDPVLILRAENKSDWSLKIDFDFHIIIHKRSIFSDPDVS